MLYTMYIKKQNLYEKFIEDGVWCMFVYLAVTLR